MEERPVLKIDRRYCPHCNEQLSARTFKAHKRRYYDSQRGEWTKKFSLESDSTRPDDHEDSPTFSFLSAQDTSDGDKGLPRSSSESPPCIREPYSLRFSGLDGPSGQSG